MCRNIDEDQDMYKMAVPASSFKLGDSSLQFQTLIHPFQLSAKPLGRFEKFRVYRVRLRLDLLGKSVLDMEQREEGSMERHGAEIAMRDASSDPRRTHVAFVLQCVP
jgi:hypothetical protein